MRVWLLNLSRSYNHEDKKFLFPSLLVCAVLALIHRLFARAFAKPAPAKPASRQHLL